MAVDDELARAVARILVNFEMSNAHLGSTSRARFTSLLNDRFKHTENKFKQASQRGRSSVMFGNTDYPLAAADRFLDVAYDAIERRSPELSDSQWAETVNKALVIVAEIRKAEKSAAQWAEIAAYNRPLDQATRIKHEHAKSNLLGWQIHALQKRLNIEDDAAMRASFETRIATLRDQDEALQASRVKPLSAFPSRRPVSHGRRQAARGSSNHTLSRFRLAGRLLTPRRIAAALSIAITASCTLFGSAYPPFASATAYTALETVNACIADGQIGTEHGKLNIRRYKVDRTAGEQNGYTPVIQITNSKNQGWIELTRSEFEKRQASPLCAPTIG